MCKILIINGHPNKDSFCNALAESYLQGAKSTDNPVGVINLAELDFSLNLKYGYKKRTDLEPDLLDAWEKIKVADHLVFVYPNWWGTYPALLKGFIDRLFLPGFAFETTQEKLGWKKLLKGKTAHIMVTMDSPGFFYKLFLRSPGHNSMKKSILSFVGIKTKRISNFRIVKTSSSKQRKRWLKKAYLLGQRAT